MKIVAGIFVETENNQVKPAATKMIEFTRQAGISFISVIPGNISHEIESWLSDYGCEQVVSLQVSETSLLNPFDLSRYLGDVIETFHITHFMGLSTPLGKDILPRVAALMDGPLVMDCLDVNLSENTAKTSQYSGKTLGTFKLEGKVKFFGVRPIPVDIEHKPVKTQRLQWNGELPQSGQFKVVKIIHSDTPNATPLSEANIILSGGRGMMNKENFSLLFDCAQVMNATVGSSRVPVDFGWVPYAMQVGQTGEKVSPRVYIACGISGSVQHFAGMKTSGIIIAVNQDENAFISSNCDYYVNADVLALIPEITRLLKQG